MAERESWDSYFLGIAKVVATRGTCDRRQVGALLVRDRSILATGYNGAARGLPHCNEVVPPHGMGPDDHHCQVAVHAEQNAIAQAAKEGTATAGSTLYTTANTCWPCFRLVLNAGVVRIVWSEFGRFHKGDEIFEAARIAGVELVGPTGAS